MRQGSRPAVPYHAAVVENLLKFGGGGSALSGCQICLSANVSRIQAGNIVDERDLPELDGAQRPAVRSARRLSFFYPRPIAPEPQAAKATASGSSAESVFSCPGTRFRRATYRLPWRMPVPLRPRPRDYLEQVSKPLRLTAGLPRRGHRPPVAARRSPYRLLHFPGDLYGSRNQRPAY